VTGIFDIYHIMLSNPVNNNFRFALQKDFIHGAVKTQFEPYFKYANNQFEDIVEYLNYTICNVGWPGISDENVKQFSRTGRSKDSQGSKLAEEDIIREITVSFNMKEGYFNWLILFYNAIEHLTPSKSHRYLADCWMDIHDDEGNVIAQQRFSQITFRRLDPLSFDVKDNGIVNKTFDMTLGYTKMSLDFFVDGKTSYKFVV
jgi:hypothetical protein